MANAELDHASSQINFPGYGKGAFLPPFTLSSKLPCSETVLLNSTIVPPLSHLKGDSTFERFTVKMSAPDNFAPLLSHRPEIVFEFGTGDTVINAKQVYAFETGSHPYDLSCCICGSDELPDDALLSHVFKSFQPCEPRALEFHSSIDAAIVSAERIANQQSFIDFVSGKTAALDAVVRQLRGSKFQVTKADGSGGVYFFKLPQGKTLAVFKPHDEEPNAPNNPNGHKNVFGTTGLTPGILSGESSFREFAAFLLDHRGVAHVPDSCLVRCWHPDFATQEPKEGSLQLFCSSQHDLEDEGDFSRIDVCDLQYMAVLDLRLCNADRHPGNILVNYENRSSKWDITAIDHGYCLPDFSGFSGISGCGVLFAWATWAQAKAPVHDAVKLYIENLNADDDLDLLMRRVPEICALRRAECLLSMRICTMLLKMCVAAGQTLAHVAALFRAPGPPDAASRNTFARCAFACAFRAL